MLSLRESTGQGPVLLPPEAAVIALGTFIRRPVHIFGCGAGAGARGQVINIKHRFPRRAGASPWHGQTPVRADRPRDRRPAEEKTNGKPLVFTKKHNIPL